MKNYFDFSGYPEDSEVLNNPKPISNGAENAANFDNRYNQEANLPTGLPSYLENWYRGYSEDPNTINPEPKLVKGFNFLQNPKTKSILKSSLQVLTVAVLIIIAGAIGGFIFLDRKINLEETQASLNRMSKTLVRESSAQDSSLMAQAAENSQTTMNEGQTIVPKIAAKTDSRVFNSSGNNNITTNSLPPTIDSDQDGLSDEIEEKLATNPFQADTDGDGYPDGVEVKNGYDPLTPASRVAPAISSSPATPIVASASATGQSCSSGGSSCKASANSNTQATNTTSNTPNVSNLTADDYQALQGYGLSESDVSRIASGGITDNDKINLQEQILSSEAGQSSIQSMVNSIAKVPLPAVSDSELNLYNTDKKEDIANYFVDLNKIFTDNLNGLANLDSAALSNHIINGDYTEIRAMHSSIEKTISALKKMRTPYDLREVQKGFLQILMVYSEISDEQKMQEQGSTDEILGELKSLNDVGSNIQKVLQEVSQKYIK